MSSTEIIGMKEILFTELKISNFLDKFSIYPKIEELLEGFHLSVTLLSIEKNRKI